MIAGTKHLDSSGVRASHGVRVHPVPPGQNDALHRQEELVALVCLCVFSVARELKRAIHVP